MTELIRSDLEPVLYELFTRAFPSWGPMAHIAWPFGTVLRPVNHEPPDRDIRVMSLGVGTAIPLTGYAYTDYVPIPIDPLLWEPAPEPPEA